MLDLETFVRLERKEKVEDLPLVQRNDFDYFHMMFPYIHKAALLGLHMDFTDCHGLAYLMRACFTLYAPFTYMYLLIHPFPHQLIILLDRTHCI